MTSPYVSPATAAYVANITTSRRPVARGRQPAPKATQPAATIWNGSHGPTPAVRSADANNVTAPSTNPNPRPSTRPAGIIRKKTAVKPVAPPPSGRSAAPHTASNNGRMATNNHGASVECGRPPAVVADAPPKNGQVNAAAPTSVTTSNAN